MKKNIFFIFAFIIFFLTNCNFLFAQNISPNISRTIPGCPYVFSKNLQSGATDPDILVMQQILNSDKRTIIAYQGPGSAGQETNYFGVATRQALKKFQALFIEYTGIADGKFSDRTREVMQTICSQTHNSTQPNTNVASTTPLIPILPLQIVLSSNANIISAGTDFKILIDTNKEIQALTPDAFIVDGAIVKEIRKLSKQQYMAIITANSDAKNIDIQIEADKVTDKDNAKNDEASNEIILQVTDSGIAQTPIASDPFSSITQTLSNLLQQLTANSPATQICNGVQILATQTCTPQNQPAAAATDPNQQASQQAQQNSTMSMLTQLLGGIMGGGGAGGGAKGQSGQAGSQAGNGGQQQTASGPAAPSDLEKAKAAAKTACESESLSGTPSSDCIAKTQTAITEQAKSDAAAKSCEGGGKDLSDSDARKALQDAGIGIGSVSTLDQLPGKTVLALKQIKLECGCDVTVTGGTSNTEHVTHGPHKAIVDLRHNAGIQNYLTSGKALVKGITCIDETLISSINPGVCGKAKSGLWTGPHWHIDATKYACGS